LVLPKPCLMALYSFCSLMVLPIIAFAFGGLRWVLSEIRDLVRQLWFHAAFSFYLDFVSRLKSGLTVYNRCCILTLLGSSMDG
jgi:hypothetical protein